MCLQPILHNSQYYQTCEERGKCNTYIVKRKGSTKTDPEITQLLELEGF